MNVSRALTAASGALLLAALTGCGSISERRLDFTHTEDVKITSITVESGSGDVVVRTADVSDVQIKRVVRYRGNEPGETYRLEGTVLFVKTGCGQHCSVSYDIVAPLGVSITGENGSGQIKLTKVNNVDIQTGSGNITVDGADGTVTTTTGSGNIIVTSAASSVTLRSGSGAINGEGLGEGKVDAETQSGDIKLTLTKAAEVRAKAGSGSINLTVPAGPYQVSSKTGSGSADIGIGNDLAATLKIDVTTGSGDITVKQG